MDLEFENYKNKKKHVCSKQSNKLKHVCFKQPNKLGQIYVKWDTKTQILTNSTLWIATAIMHGLQKMS